MIAERYEAELKAGEAKGEAARAAVSASLAACSRACAPPTADGVLVKWRGLGYEEATRERWSDVLDACGDKDALDAQVAQCAARFSNSSAKPQAKARMAKDKTSVKSTKHAVPLAPYRGGPLQLRPYQIDGVAWLA